MPERRNFTVNSYPTKCQHCQKAIKFIKTKIGYVAINIDDGDLHTCKGKAKELTSRGLQNGKRKS